MKFTFTLLAASLLLAACRHTEAAHQRPTGAEILQHIVGTWTTAEDPQWAAYHVVTIRSNGSFATLWTNCPSWEDTGKAFRTNTVCEGTWRLDRGVLILTRSDTHPDFHMIDRIDDHTLDCQIGFSVAGQWRFKR